MSDKPTDIFAQLGGNFPRQATAADRPILTAMLDERITTLNKTARQNLRNLNLLSFAFSKLAVKAMGGISTHIKAGKPVTLKRSKDNHLSIEKTL